MRKHRITKITVVPRPAGSKKTYGVAYRMVAPGHMQIVPLPASGGGGRYVKKVITRERVVERPPPPQETPAVGSTNLTGSVEVNGQTVTFTIPITVTVSIGTPTVQAGAAVTHTSPIPYQFDPGHHPGYGWLAWCGACRRNRWLTVQARFPEMDLLGYCNVCTCGWRRPDGPIRHIGHEVLHRQKYNPDDADPPPVDYDAARRALPSC